MMIKCLTKRAATCALFLSISFTVFQLYNQHKSVLQSRYEERKSDTSLKKPNVFYLKIPRVLRSSCWEQPCNNFQEIRWRMVLFVKSAAANHEIRDAIRRTWGSLSYLDKAQLGTVFVLGRAAGKAQYLIEEEDKNYGDILQLNVSDDYKFLAHKTLGGMRWASEHLRSDDFYSSCDDDVIINMGGLVATINWHLAKAAKDKWPEFPIICTYRARINSIPSRKNNSKYFTSKNEYKWPFWPDFCLGAAYTTSVKVIRQLWRVSFGIDLIKMDDVLITGVLRERIGMPRQFIRRLDQSLASHNDGYRKLKRTERLKFITNEWKKLSNNFKNKDSCTCKL